MNTSTMTQEERWVLEEKYAGVETPEYQADKRRLAAGEPVAYVIGSQPFLGLAIHLDSKPLIPRPETEWWTEQLLNQTREADSRTFAFLDLCAGSGAIGCAALARLPEATVHFGEINPAHEATIRKNIRENGLDAARASICIGDLFEPFHNLTFDVIATNPPYIPIDRALDPSVSEHEPSQALRGGKDGLDYIRRIAAELPHHLTRSGVAWIECDSTRAMDTAALFTASGMRTTIRTDQYGMERCVVVSFP